MESFEERMKHCDRHITEAEKCLEKAQTQNAAGRQERADFWLKKADVHAHLARVLLMG